MLHHLTGFTLAHSSACEVPIMSTSPIYSTASLRHFVAQFVACTFVASAVVLGGCAVDSTAPRSAITAPNAAVQADIQADAGDGSGQRFLIADQFNNRVIEVDRTGNILWSFGRGPNDVSP